ncbi:MAG: AmpG family muropeptide MFS transporter [Wenzhouxiangella sp.]|nr:AmpG family muropeptide MFS transporter [Wenzhouxiangella sp.]
MPTDPAASPRNRRSWRAALGVYARPTVARMLLLGFSAGLPFMLVFSTLTAWLRSEGVSRTAIGFFAWVGITYSIKVLWAPVVDRVRLPLLTAWLGQRRSWMLTAQLVIMVGLAAMAFTDPLSQLTQLALLAVMVAFASATQDITIDAFRIESDAVEYQAALAGTYVLGYRLALLATGAGALFVADQVGWTLAYLAMAALVIVGLFAVMISPEPSTLERLDIEREPLVIRFRERTRLRGAAQEFGAWITGAVVAPFVDFIRRFRWLALPVLALIGLYKASDLSMAAMANPLYLDVGYSLSQIGAVSGLFGVAMTILGGLVGGIMVARFGLMPMMLVGAIGIAATNLLFAWLATMQPVIWALTVTITGDNFFVGFSATVFIAWMSGLVSRRYTATQYALFSSLMTLPGKFLGGPSGWIVDQAGYVFFFFYASALGIPAMLLVIYLMHRKTELATRSSDTASVASHDEKG